MFVGWLIRMRKLRIRCKGRCRGNGKLYTLLEVPVEDGEQVIADSFRDGISYPNRLINLNGNEYVLVLPDFREGQEVRIATIDVEDGVHTGEAHMAISPARYALASKCNGVIRKSLCDRIRNIDEVGAHGEVLIACEGLIPTENGYLLRGSISNRFKGEVTDVVAYSLDGAILSDDCIFLNRFGAASSNERTATDTLFSMRIPFGADGVCLAAKDASGRICDSFVSMKQDVYEKLIEASAVEYMNATDDWRYQNWFARKRISSSGIEKEREHSAALGDDAPLFSIIVPLFKTPLDFFRDMADSVVSQTYPKWELVLVNASPEDKELDSVVREYAELDSRITVVNIESNLGITENTNKGIEVARGDYICFFDHDDVLEPDILFEYYLRIKQYGEVDLLYCDEDKLFPDGSYGTPVFKPDFSIDMVRDNNYICHLLTVRKAAYESIEPSSAELDGAQDHAMVLKISELGGVICHVPKVLYHWRISENSTAGNADSKPYATTAGIKAVSDHLRRVGLNAHVECAHGRAFRYKVDYLQDKPAMVSLIIPTRGDYSALENVFSFVSKTDYPALELILVTNSIAPEQVERVFETIVPNVAVKVVPVSGDFQYPKWLNEGARNAKGSCLVFAHDDIAPCGNDWITVLSGLAMRSDVGAAGTMTCDFDGTIQQAGLSFVRDSRVPLSKGISSDTPGYIFYPLTTRNVAAVSGVCLATSRDAYKAIGGFDESFANSYSDVDYCFAADSLGLNVVYTAEAMLNHGRIAANAFEGSCDYERARVSDKAVLLKKWSSHIANGDRYFNPGFSRVPQKAARYQLDC